MEYKEQLETVINALSQSVTNENFEKNKDIFNTLKVIHDENPRQFLSVLEIANHKFDMLLDGVFDIPKQKNQYIIRFIANGLYEHFHESRIQNLEGRACCADKSGFIRDMTLKALKVSQNLSLYADYTNVERIKEDKERQAYWSPKSVKDTDEAIQLFWDWYRLRDKSLKKMERVKMEHRQYIRGALTIHQNEDGTIQLKDDLSRLWCACGKPAISYNLEDDPIYKFKCAKCK